MSLSIENLSFDSLPDSAYLRQSQIVRNPKKPNSQAIFPFSGTTLWRSVKAKNFPAPIKLSKGVTVWRVGDIRSYLKTIKAKSQGGAA